MKFFGRGVLTAFLLLFSISLLSLTSCVEDNPHPEINLTFEEDYSAIIAAINSMDRNLSEKLSLIESAAAAGFADSEAQQKLIESVIREEENAFLRTLDRGIRLLDDYMEKNGPQRYFPELTPSCFTIPSAFLSTLRN